MQSRETKSDALCSACHYFIIIFPCSSALHSACVQFYPRKLTIKERYWYCCRHTRCTGQIVVQNFHKLLPLRCTLCSFCILCTVTVSDFFVLLLQVLVQGIPYFVLWLKGTHTIKRPEVTRRLKSTCTHFSLYPRLTKFKKTAVPPKTSILKNEISAIKPNGSLPKHC